MQSDKLLDHLFANLSSDVIKLTSLYFSKPELEQDCRSEFPLLDESANAYHLSSEQVFELVHMKDISSSLIPSKAAVEQKIRELDRSSLNRERQFRYRVAATVNGVLDRLKYMKYDVKEEADALAGARMAKDSIEECLRIQHEASADKENVSKCCSHIMYLQRVNQDLTKKLDTLRTGYMKDIIELKAELGYMGVPFPRATLTEANEHHMTAPEMNLYEGMVKNEQQKNDRLKKWIQNLKIQLKVER
ncbi:hypothetical protein HDU91_004393, partial [Kappamyces sp. JEL0680]